MTCLLYAALLSSLSPGQFIPSLGSNNYKVRCAAHRILDCWGDSAGYGDTKLLAYMRKVEELQDRGGLTSKDMEVRRRCLIIKHNTLWRMAAILMPGDPHEQYEWLKIQYPGE